MKSLALILMGLGLTTLELPPGSYDRMRKDADEAVIINVTKVTIDAATQGNAIIDEEFNRASEIILTAQVLEVEKGTNIKAGDNILIRYRVYEARREGPRPLTVLKVGIYPAFLNKIKDEMYYSPAAHGESFTMTPEN